MGAYSDIVAELEKAIELFGDPPTSFADDPQYSPNHVLEIVKAVRAEALEEALQDKFSISLSIPTGVEENR